MSEAAEVTDATEVMSEASTTRTALDPIMVASYVRDTWAIWQVETDPDVQLGDFSGAWIIGPEGIQGFAADAEWIEERDDQRAMLHTVVRYPVIPVDDATRNALENALEEANTAGTKSAPITIVEWSLIEDRAAEAIAQAKEDFSAEFEGKKQPAWGSIAPLADALDDVELHSPIKGLPGGEDGNAAQAAGNALAFARGLRTWIRDWNTFDKLRVRRLGPVLTKHSEVTGLPLS